MEFLLSAMRDAAAAELLFHHALSDPAHPQPRVINTDKARPPLLDDYRSEKGENPEPPLPPSTGTILE
jgi:transposase-like protein